MITIAVLTFRWELGCGRTEAERRFFWFFNLVTICSIPKRVCSLIARLDEHYMEPFRALTGCPRAWPARVPPVSTVHLVCTSQLRAARPLAEVGSAAENERSAEGWRTLRGTAEYDALSLSFLGVCEGCGSGDWEEAKEEG